METSCEVSFFDILACVSLENQKTEKWVEIECMHIP